MISHFLLPHLQINPLDPHHLALGVHHHSRVHLLHHAVLGQESHRLPNLRPPATAHRPLKGSHQADADVLGRWKALQQVHRPDQVHGYYPLPAFENFRKMGDRAAQRPVSEDVALFQPRFRIEGVKVLPAGWLIPQRGQGKVRPQPIQNADDLLSLLRAGQQRSDLLGPAFESLLPENWAPVQTSHIHQLGGKLPAAAKAALPAVVSRQELFDLLHLSSSLAGVLHESVQVAQHTPVMLPGDAQLPGAEGADGQRWIMPQDHLSIDIRPAGHELGKLCRALA
jgi:hypothetical protein